jgi:amino acid adenylation domain-containing protein/thioester reductase-like protein
MMQPFKNLDQIKLSPYAKMFCIEWLIHPSSARYNMIFMDELSGDVDVCKLKQSIRKYIRDHFLLHSHIENKEGEFLWVENTEIFEMEYSDEPAGQEELLDYINEPFDLYKDQLCRFKLFRLGREKYQFITVLHHLVTDALSVKAGLFEALSNYYNNKEYAQPYSIKEQKEKLSELADYYDEKLSNERTKHQEFWNCQIENIERVTLDFLKRENKPSQKICLDKYNLDKKIKFEFDSTAIDQLARLKRKYLITPYYFGLCVFATLLYKYSGQKKFAVPYPVAINKGIDHIFGAQVNTTLMPYQFKRGATFLEVYNQNRQFLKSVKNNNFNYTDFPNIELFNERNKNLLNIVFNQANFRFQTFTFDGVMQKSMLNAYNMHLKDMLIFEQEQKEQFLCYQVRFDITQMDEILVQNFADNFQRLFIEILNHLEKGEIDKSIDSYSLMTFDRHKYIEHDLNHTQQWLSNQKTIHSLFIEQAKKTPDHIAVTFENIQLTYRELNQCSDQLAIYIQQTYNLQPEEFIVLHLDRSHHMLIAILAILKIDCAYIPVSPDSPDNALWHILKDSKSKLILANALHEENLTRCIEKCHAKLEQNPQLLIIDVPTTLTTPNQIHTITPRNKNNKNLAYVIYTSGSTGEPKGVMMEHLACVNKVMEMIRISQINEEDIILFKTNYIFDVSFTDIFCGLLVGAHIIITKNSFDIEEISHHLEKNAITLCHFTPSQFGVLKALKGSRLFYKLRVIHFSGEALNSSLLSDVDEKIRCINYYGPTETGEVSSEQRSGASSNLVTIGYPMANIQFHILDENYNPVPLGVLGELYIGGVALARGYLNKPDLTTEKFIKNPFQNCSENGDTRIYKTGDFARRLVSGNVEYTGRADSQVKIRGYRIELEGIENQLNSFPEIKQAIVLAKAKNRAENISWPQEKYLIAYYVSEHKLEALKIRRHLSERLPAYMVPDVFRHLNQLPLTANGKLDIDKLPSVERCDDDVKHISPKNILEEKICVSYAEILNLATERVSIDDDFFELGGDSLSAISLLFKLEQQNFNIRITDIFKYRTPQKIAENIFLVNNNICQKINNIVEFYLKYNYAIRNYQVEEKDHSSSGKNIAYLESVKKLRHCEELVNIENVLLTGSTGHLGCNILGKLLTETNYKIYLLIRADSGEMAWNRIVKKFRFYFNVDLNSYKERVIALKADIQQSNFGLQHTQFNALVDQIDSVIHCASLVKHYGEYNEFYQANVQATINLLDFSKIMRGKNFNYISTLGVLVSGYVPGQDYYLVNEDDAMENFRLGKNFYVQTKYQAELLILKYRELGLNGSIFRVGNLGMHSANYQVQENIEENLFFSHFKAMLSLKMVPKEISKMEISPVDCTADAIVKLFNKASLENKMHHIFNPKICDLMEVFTEFSSAPIEKCTLAQFVKALLNDICIKKITENPYLSILFQLWIHEGDEVHATKMRIANDKTEAILGQLGFSWPAITPAMMTKFINHAYGQPIE